MSTFLLRSKFASAHKSCDLQGGLHQKKFRVMILDVHREPAPKTVVKVIVDQPEVES